MVQAQKSRTNDEINTTIWASQQIRQAHHSSPSGVWSCDEDMQHCRELPGGIGGKPSHTVYWPSCSHCNWGYEEKFVNSGQCIPVSFWSSCACMLRGMSLNWTRLPTFYKFEIIQLTTFQSLQHHLYVVPAATVTPSEQAVIWLGMTQGPTL